MSSTLNYATIREVSLAEWLVSYISLPAFSYNIGAWKGASEIITQFNYAASKNFTVRRLPVVPANVNFCLVIRWRSGDIVYRYKLWQTVGETLNEKIYNGEKIGANFVLEIWSTQTNSVVSLASAVTFNTSIRAVPSTSYLSIDPYEEVAGVEVAAQSYSNIVGSYVTTNLVAHWRADDVVDSLNWADRISGKILNMVSNGGGFNHLEAFNYQASFGLARTSVPALWSGVGFSVSDIYVVFSMSNWTLNDPIFKTTAGGLNLTIIQNAVANDIKFTHPSVPGFIIANGGARALNQAYILRITAFTGKAYLYNLGSSVPLYQIATNQAVGNSPITNIALGSADVDYAEILMYNATQTDEQIAANLTYIGTRYMAAIETFPTTQDSNIPGGNNT